MSIPPFEMCTRNDHSEYCKVRHWQCISALHLPGYSNNNFQVTSAAYDIGWSLCRHDLLFVAPVWPERSSSAAGVRTSDLIDALKKDWDVHFLRCVQAQLELLSRIEWPACGVVS